MPKSLRVDPRGRRVFQRTLRVEQLEARALLAVSFSVNATLNWPNSPSGPVPDAYVDISVPIGGGRTTDLTGVTGSDGTVTISNSQVVATGSATGVLYAGHPGTTQYWVDGGAGTAVYSQAFTPVLNGTANVTVASNSTPTNPLDLTWNAFRIYTTVISVYNNFAMDVLGASLPDALAIHYAAPSASMPGAEFAGVHVTGQPGKLANIGLYLPANQVIMQPDQIGHEFGHYVAYESGFLNEGSAAHSTGFNTRFYPPPSLPSTAPGPVLTQNNVNVAFDEGWADYYVVAAKLWYQKTNPLLANKAHLVDYQAPSQLVPFSAMFDPWSLTSSHAFYYLDATNVYYQTRATQNVRIRGQLGRGEDEEISIARILWQLADSGKYQNWSDAALFCSLVTGSLPGGTNAGPITPITTLNAIASQLQLFSSAASVENYGPLFASNGAAPTPVSSQLGTGGLTLTFNLPLINSTGGSATAQQLLTFNQATISFVTSQATQLNSYSLTVPLQFSSGRDDPSAARLTVVGYGFDNGYVQCTYRLSQADWTRIRNLIVQDPNFTGNVYWTIAGSVTKPDTDVQPSSYRHRSLLGRNLQPGHFTWQNQAYRVSGQHDSRSNTERAGILLRHPPTRDRLAHGRQPRDDPLLRGEC